MIGIIGIVVVFVMVFGGFVMAGGHFDIILHSLPYEMTMIGGAAVGAFLIANNGAGVKQTLKDIGKVFKGASWKPKDYNDLLCLLFELIRLARQNPVALEEHIEAPDSSDIISRYPKIQKDHEAIELICDTLRSMTLSYDDPMQVEEVLDKRMEASFEHAMHSSHAMQTVADGLPALGIVAAVLGVIKTMAAIDQPPEVLGGLIGGALVGTFLGVFLAYGFVGPFASKMGTVVQDDSHFYKLIREVLIANLHNHPANMCIEVGRQNTPHHLRPSYGDLEEAMRSLKREAG
ncbi:flagellar motor stator protein MotA [Pararhodobacter zhoushanensis]|uniref:Flagellar motor stator protein MotA n=1 Tax=Pararhodobacter zhoushanensis TaxID=2479545 RepID=A0ABT3GXZ2_9RHOB|nr:flagellar motor stator protein MotA [Pararhodobacter zhoushanensis]MCW1932391.1 flagellar motor stator protein MotA [Pararhodobacter zhoushanensis]